MNNLFKLAEIELEREGKQPDNITVLEYAIYIRKWLDKHGQNTANRILAGDKFYCYGNIIKTYSKTS